MHGLSRAIFLVTVALSLMGCGASFRPVEMDVRPLAIEESRGTFPSLLITHLAKQRNVPFAVDTLSGMFDFMGAIQTDDQRHTIFLLRNRSLQTLALSYAYVYFHLMDDPYIIADQNTSAYDRSGGHSTEPDAIYKGLYRLSLMNARLCYGEAKERPSIEGNEVKLQAAGRVMRRSMYDYMTSHYTPTTCQGDQGDSVPGSPPGVRFYFDTEEEMKSFASALTGAFPLIKAASPEH